MNLTINLDKRDSKGKPTVHVSPKEATIYRNNQVIKESINVEIIENGITVTLGRFKPYAVCREEPRLSWL